MFFFNFKQVRLDQCNLPSNEALLCRAVRCLLSPFIFTPICTQYTYIRLFVFPSLEISDLDFISWRLDGGGVGESPGGLTAARLTTRGDLFMRQGEFLSWLCDGTEAVICQVNAANPAPGDRLGSVCLPAVMPSRLLSEGRENYFY